MRRLAFSCIFLTAVLAQTWCGKHYKPGQDAVAPGGTFPLLAPSSDSLLALRCAPAIRPYLAEDIASSPTAAVVIDTPVVYHNFTNAVPIQLVRGHTVLDVSVSLDDLVLATGQVLLDSSVELPFSLEDITPRKAAYDLTCSATYAGTSQMFSTTTPLSVLPNPSEGSVTKMDLRTGALLAKPATGLSGDYEPVFPIGFYTDFGYLASNLSVIDELKGQGFTIIHPVPSFENLTALNLVLDRMQQVGLYLMYDMRFTYMNATAVTEQVNAIKHRPNLLLWYTADEPDGTSDPLDATTIAYDLIYALDGYHPVSLVLNCQDYYWSAYTAGADVVMQDVYMVGNNVSWSTVWNTTCTSDYGDCGCDNCASIPEGDVAAIPPNSTYYGASNVPANSGIGSFFDVSARVATFRERLQVMGWERSKAVWTVPQAFGGTGEYWSRAPTGEEWVVQSIMGINQGALGVVPWVDPTPADIKSASSAFATSLPEITPFLFNPQSIRTTYLVDGVVSVATWRAGGQTLVLAANANYVDWIVKWDTLYLWGTATTVFASGVLEVVDGGFKLGPVGSGAFVVVA